MAATDDAHTERSMATRPQHLRIQRRRRGKALRRNYPQGKGELQHRSHRRSHTDIIDHIRHRDHPTRRPYWTALAAPLISKGLRHRLQANPHTIMRLPRYLGRPDDRMEGCPTNDSLDTGQRPIQPRCYVGVPQSSPRRSDRGSQDHLDSTWATKKPHARALGDSITLGI